MCFREINWFFLGEYFDCGSIKVKTECTVVTFGGWRYCNMCTHHILFVHRKNWHLNIPVTNWRKSWLLVMVCCGSWTLLWLVIVLGFLKHSLELAFNICCHYSGSVLLQLSGHWLTELLVIRTVAMTVLLEYFDSSWQKWMFY